MHAYFETRQRELYAELESWKGTPWRHRAMVRGAGTDCIGMVAGVLINTGFLDPAWTPPDYPRDWHMHNDDERLVEALRGAPGMVEFSRETVSNGDVVVFRYGRVGSHVGIYYQRGVYHAVTGLRVIRSPFREGNYFTRLRHVFRPMEMEAAA